MAFQIKDQAHTEPRQVVYLSERPPVPVEMLAGYGDLLSIADLHELTGLAPNTLRRAIADGELPGRKMCGKFIVRKDAFLNFLQGGDAYARA